jgi:lipooligosaccharide transport system permease protein
MASPAAHVLEHRLLLYRRTWRGSVFNSFLSPVLFLGAMGLGLGGYVDASASAALGGVVYLAFLAPGLLAATAMQTAAGEATFPVLASIQWTKQYQAMLATPIDIRDIVMGQIAFFAIRLALVAAIFVAVVAVVGAAVSPLIVLAIPAAVLTGLAFATPIAALSARLRDGAQFSLIFRFGITPLFLFSGTFFPISSLPPIAQAIAWITPLYQGVALTRALSLGTVAEDPLAMLFHVLYLSTFAIVGAYLTIRMIERRLVRG